MINGGVVREVAGSKNSKDQRLPLTNPALQRRFQASKWRSVPDWFNIRFQSLRRVGSAI